MARLTGMDIKLEQYRRGERFVAGVYRVGGAAAIEHLWDGPETLPTEQEMDDPAAWVRRVTSGGTRSQGSCMTKATRGGREPAAIALTPILSARYREEDLARIRAAAPDARLVNVSLEGLSDSSLDDVEVLLRGPMPHGQLRSPAGALPELALGALGHRWRGAGADAGEPPNGASSSPTPEASSASPSPSTR